MREVFRRYLSRYSKVLVPLSCLGFVVFVSTPFALYVRNEAEFQSGILDMLRHEGLPIVCGVLLLSGLLALIPQVLFPLLSALLAALVLLVYVQGTFLVRDYGPFNGEPIDWPAYAVWSRIDTVIWLSCLVLCALFHRRLSRALMPLVVFVALASGVTLLSESTRGEYRLMTPPQRDEQRGIFRLSGQKNVIEIVLDTFSSPAFDAVRAAHPDIAVALKDFTFYPDTTGSFTTTAPSLPAILSGIEYDNTEPMKDFLARVLPAASLPALLDQNRFGVSVMSLPQLCRPLQQPCYKLGKVISGDARKVERQELLELLDISLFRVLPQPLKQAVYNNQRWFLQRILTRRISPAGHYHSFRFAEVFARSLSIDADTPQYKFFHLALPHAPFRFDADCSVVEKGSTLPQKAQYEGQAACALRLVVRMLEALKAAGVYEQTMVLVHADHGYVQRFLSYDRGKELPIIEQAMPLLLIKPFAASQEMLSISQAPASLVDIPKTVADALRLENTFPGESLLSLREDAQRTRSYRSYGWRDDFWDDAYLPKMQQYDITGNVREVASWKRGIKLAAPK